MTYRSTEETLRAEVARLTRELETKKRPTRFTPGPLGVVERLALVMLLGGWPIGVATAGIHTGRSIAGEGKRRDG